MLSLVYPSGTRALDKVNLRLDRGEFVSLVGQSGCGKSSLLRVVAGLVAPTSGNLTVADWPPLEARRRKAVRLAFVFQDPTLVPWRSVSRNVALPLELARLPKAERATRVKRGLALVGLSEFARRRPRELSGGMRMRVSLARALAAEPELLLLDEPFGALDDITRQALNDELLALWQRDRWSTVFVTHNLQEAAFLSSRVLVMGPRPGKIVADMAVPFDMPRRPALRTEPDFARFVGQLADILREGRG